MELDPQQFQITTATLFCGRCWKSWYGSWTRRMQKISVSLCAYLLLWVAKHAGRVTAYFNVQPWPTIQRQPVIWATSSSCAVKMIALTPTASLTNTSRSTSYLFTTHSSHTVTVTAMPPLTNASSSDAAKIFGHNTVYQCSLALLPHQWHYNPSPSWSLLI